MGVEGLLVDDDAEPGTGRGVEQVAAQLALDRCDRRGEEALGGKAVG